MSDEQIEVVLSWAEYAAKFPWPEPNAALRNVVTLAAEVRRLRSALAAAEAVGWQPIETAPRDGSEIEVGRWVNGEWRICQTSWHHFPGNEFEGEHSVNWWACDADWGGITEDEGPTHWRPIPIPPAAENGNG